VDILCLLKTSNRDPFYRAMTRGGKKHEGGEKRKGSRASWYLQKSPENVRIGRSERHREGRKVKGTREGQLKLVN